MAAQGFNGIRLVRAMPGSSGYTLRRSGRRAGSANSSYSFVNDNTGAILKVTQKGNTLLVTLPTNSGADAMDQISTFLNDHYATFGTSNWEFLGLQFVDGGVKYRIAFTEAAATVVATAPAVPQIAETSESTEASEEATGDATEGVTNDAEAVLV